MVKENNKKQIIVSLCGGLGNQLWQLAFALMLKNKYKFNEILLDPSYYKQNKIRAYELENFELPKYINLYKGKARGYSTFTFLSKVFSKIRGACFKISNRYIDNNIKCLYRKGFFISHNLIPQDINEVDSNIIFVSGYFQNYNLIKDILPELRQLLVPKAEGLSQEYTKLRNEILDDEDSVAISVRCGDDYQKLKWNICGKQYFMKAIQTFHSKHFYVFSDNIERARQMLKGNNFTFVSQLSATEQLFLMKECRGFILSNSTFSYWGALLSENATLTIYPEKWFPYLFTEDAGILHGEYHIIRG